MNDFLVGALACIALVGCLLLVALSIPDRRD